jgi:hypothetical protein
MDVLRLVIVLAAVAFQCFTGHPASLLRDAVIKLIAGKRVPTFPIWRFHRFEPQPGHGRYPGSIQMESHSD